MNFSLGFLTILSICQMALAGRYNITCYYDTFSIQRGGFANFTENDLKTSFEYCTHIVYGYVGLSEVTFDIETLHQRQHQQFDQVRKLKNQYRHVTFLLSLGGNKDLRNPEKYIKLLESNGYNQERFISSVKQFLQKYNFDGLDLAYQFPRNKKKVLPTVIKKVKQFVKKKTTKLPALKHSKKVDNNNSIHKHKQQFTALVSRLKNALRHGKFMLTLTLLPSVNASKYLNIPAIIGDFDFVNLGTFDYSTPESTPHEADFLAPLHAPSRHYKNLPQANVDNEVHKWISQHVPAGKLNIGIAAFGRTWKMTKKLKSSVMPITSSLAGPAQGGELTHTPGIFSWPEICLKLPKMSKIRNKKYGNYAYRSANIKGQEGLFITYEDSDSLTAKAEFVENNSLGGVALFDLTLDDFRGKCLNGKFPALKALKFRLH